MSFFNELKRRNVFRVGTAYLIVAWLLLQVVDTISPLLNLTETFGRGVLLLLAIGFPIALVISWIYEVTPDGITTQEAVDAGARTTSGYKLNAVIISALVLAVVFMAVDNYVLVDSTPAIENTAQTNDLASDEITVSTAQEKSIAVLPFANLSNDPDQEYFSDGLTEELINKLSQVNDLQVTGRNSSFYFKGRDEDLFEIGRLLGVEHILQGSVRKAGNQLRITAQLMEVDENTNLWSQTFDRELDDIFAIQDEIAEDVTTALSVTLSAGEFNRLGMTTNVDAYDAFMQGNKFVLDADNGKGERIRLDAIGQFENAVQLDPAFALGWIRLAQAYGQAYTLLPPDQTTGFRDRASAARQRAQDLEPNLPELKYGQVNGLINVQQRYAEGEAILQELLDSSGGSDTDAAALYSNLLWVAGRPRDALVYAQQVRRLDPQDGDAPWLLSTMLLNLNRIDEARDEMARAQTLDNPRNLFGLQFIASLMEGDKEAVLRSLEAAPQPNPGLINIARLWLNEGNAAALAAVHEIVDEGNMSNLALVLMREWAGVLGDPELGLDLLNRLEFTSGDIWLPLYSNIRQLPGFKDYVRREGLVDYWRETGNWSDFCRPLEGSDDFECF